jgi:hypothetical protein
LIVSTQGVASTAHWLPSDHRVKYIKAAASFLKPSFCMLLLLLGCANQNTSNPYIKAQQISNYATSADLWLLRTRAPRGVLPYAYNPENNRYRSKRNLSSELHTARRLANLALTRARFNQPASDLVGAISTNWLSSDDEGSRILERGKSSLGANALWLRVQIARYKKSQDEDLLQQIDQQATLIRQGFTREKGFHQWLSPEETRSTYYQRLYTGQAALALLEHSALLNDTRSLKIAESALNWLSNRYPTDNSDNFHPSLIPWHAFAIAQHFNLTGDNRHLKNLFLMSTQLIKLQSDSDFPGQFMTPKKENFGQPNAIRDALSTLVLLESLKIAEQMQEARWAKKLRRAIWPALMNIRSLQYDHGKVSAFPKPQNAVGAMRYGHNEALIRLDATVFGAEAFEKAATLIRRGLL